MKRALTWTGIVLAGVVLLLAAAAGWISSTNGGARWTLARVSGVLGDVLQVERVDGTLVGPLTLTNVRYRDPKSGIDAAVESVEVDVALRDLLRTTVHVVNADIRGVVVTLSEPTAPAEEPQSIEPFTLEAPIDIVIDKFALRNADVSRDQQSLVRVDSAAFAGSWVGSNVAVQRLDLQSPQGEVHFAADVRQQQYYEGNGRGRFRWQVGEREFAGSLEATGEAAVTHLIVKLTAPLDAALSAQLQQADDWPWKFALDAPQFDPREELMPDSSLTSLAATLKGEGSLREGEIAGVVQVNGEPIRLERAHFVQRPDAIDLDSVVLLGGGRVQATGLVHTREQPVAAELRVLWRDIVVPATLAGQELFTRGDIDVSGSAEQYRARGKMKLGPDRRMADLELKVLGTPQRVTLEQFDIVQQPGRLALTGAVDVQPQLAWAVRAQARKFDPGAFAVAWKGSLDFDLESAGSLLEAGPQATLQLTSLKGRLRNRDVGGRADLKLSPGMVLAGDLDLTSGSSRVRVVGEHGETMNAVATIEVPSVNDWLPDGAGALNGRIEAKGKWPDLNVSGRLDGNALEVATLRAQTLAARWNVDKPTQPRGNATLEATQVVASGFEFATVRAVADGDMRHHSLDFAATGSPLATAFLLEGSSAAPNWSGTLQRLKIDFKDAARLALQRPVDIKYSPDRVSMSEACLVDGRVHLCLQGERQASGALQARYDLTNVPLALANAFAPASMPLVFDGTLDGRGDVSSTADGVFKGRADIRSARMQVSRPMEATADQPEVLLTIADLNLVADLSGPDANARLNARLNDTGALQGRVALRGLAEPVTNVDGAVSASLPSLRVIEMFAPQLANVQGRADLRASARGTLDDPQINGEFRASELGMDVPEFGLKLRNGTLSVAPIDKERFKIAGGMSSGPGKIEFNGAATTAGIVHMALSGKQFQAADIPSAQVLIDPDLKFERVPERMQVSGTVTIPSANIDLQKLPKKERTQNASPDVVVIDAKTQEEAQADAIPLYADVRVILGEKVTLVGYGLDAKVNGQLAVKEQPGSPTTGSGEVRVEGTYKAYGQDLAIQQGQLLFAGTPIDNPRLNIVAVRVVDEVTAGLRVTGSAQNPQLVVFSDPAMGQSDALAYVVTGKPLSEVGSSDGEGDALQTAARSIGTATGGLLAKKIGSRLGVDELGIKDSEALGGAALTIGQYLSPRLYLSYGVGVFEPGEVITLRYKLSKELALEALNSSKDSRAGIEYRMER